MRGQRELDGGQVDVSGVLELGTQGLGVCVRVCVCFCVSSRVGQVTQRVYKVTLITRLKGDLTLLFT